MVIDALGYCRLKLEVSVIYSGRFGFNNFHCVFSSIRIEVQVPVRSLGLLGLNGITRIFPGHVVFIARVSHLLVLLKQPLSRVMQALTASLIGVLISCRREFLCSI